MKKEQAPKIEDDPFLFFKDTTLKKFEFLVRKFGFKVVQTITHVPECVIEYRNSTTILAVSYEWGSELWVTLEPTNQPPAVLEGAHRIGLDFLIAIRCPGLSVEKNRPAKEWTDELVESILSRYAAAMTECASDVLRGDFTVPPEVKRYTAAVARAREFEI
jgi:hypothetical protein